MSAYIVGDRTINAVVGFLSNELNDHRYNVEEILKVAGIAATDEDWREKLGARMFEMNCEAVNQRYRDRAASGQFRELNYIWSWVCANRFEVLKSLSCWLYQCAEGDVFESPLYRAFDDYRGSLAYRIVSDLPQFQAAKGW